MCIIRKIAVAITALTFATTVHAQSLDVLSGGAIEPGILAAAEAYKKQTGVDAKVRFQTAPQIAKLIGEGGKADVVLAPPGVINELVKSGKLDGSTRPNVGKVGVGVASRPDGPTPDVRTSDSLRAAVLAAESIVYNSASSGQYIDRLFERWGIAAAVKAKEKRYPTGAAVMEHLLKGKGHEFGFGPQTEIMLYRDKGLRQIGPLPADVQNFTTYDAVAHASPANAAGAKAFLQFLAQPATRKIFAEKGVE